MKAQRPQTPITILIPVFNDGPAVAQLLEKIDSVLKDNEMLARVLLVDDASIEPPQLVLAGLEFGAILQVDVLALRRNLGHQRAIAVGLAYVEQHMACRAVLIMDGDGEDAPEDIPRLVDQFERADERCIIFAARKKRSETWIFQAFYHLYRFLHLLLTGIPVRVGNFSIVPWALVRRLVVVSELWNHYAAAVFRSRIPYKTLATARAPRLAGRSHMNFVALVVHGLSAISVFSEYVGVRLLLFTGATTFLVVTLASVGLAGLFHAERAVPEAVYPVAGLLVILLVQSLALSIGFSLSTLYGRANANFLPIRDYGYFVDNCQTIYRARTPSGTATPAREQETPDGLSVVHVSR